MELSSGSSSNSRFGGRKVCDCGLPAKIFKSKTARNPHRKFYGCELYKEGGNAHCKYFRWVDEEEVKGWPRQALVEAEAEINEKIKMISQLKSTIKELRGDLEKKQLEISSKNAEMERIVYRQRIVITGLTGLLVCAVGAIVFG
ncbi:PREDICTED: uncharacterized protein At4g04775-like [Camelina sativa]|uniref:Uncharacterized protein At4g04775-like n=1 Tax=Camelina sativa TaxID=90675 RepID=A0ABM0TFQ3_CAMSA|nr:PREDICTED: uncharacterized protein At4g04775-like [Camelina sativa]XP_010451575.1 PREDICTED: uncharacterized protein At4g04775-like [Camelina sativa]